MTVAANDFIYDGGETNEFLDTVVAVVFADTTGSAGLVEVGGDAIDFDEEVGETIGFADAGDETVGLLQTAVVTDFVDAGGDTIEVFEVVVAIELVDEAEVAVELAHEIAVATELVEETVVALADDATVLLFTSRTIVIPLLVTLEWKLTRTSFSGDLDDL